MKQAIAFLQSKGLLKHGCTEFTITGDFGTISLIDLLTEFKDQNNVQVNIDKLIDSITIKVAPEDLDTVSKHPEIATEKIEAVFTEKLVEILKNANHKK